MDIEETLRRLRELVATVRGVQSRTQEDGDLTDEDRNTLLDTAEALAGGFTALDEWLRLGGYLPADWRKRTIDRPARATDPTDGHLV